MNILKSIDFTTYRPLIVILEMIPFTMPYKICGKDKVIQDYMESAGYHEYAFTGINSIFLDKEQLEKKGRLANDLPKQIAKKADKRTDARRSEAVKQNPPEYDRIINAWKAKYGTVDESAPPRAPLVSQIATAKDLTDFSDWMVKMGIPLSDMHRKCWEWGYIAQVLYERGYLKAGNRGLVFACGSEPLPALFASYGVYITATDLDLSNEYAEQWKGGNQHASDLSALERPAICNRDDFSRLVEFRPVDMTAIPSDLKDYDFCWSSCAFEHLENIDKARAFVHNTIETLKTGGVSVHTTEFNLSGVDTGEIPHSLVFGVDFLESLRDEIISQGHYFAPFDYRIGDNPIEDWVFNFKNTDHHFKLLLGSKISTSIGIIIVKNGAMYRR